MSACLPQQVRTPDPKYDLEFGCQVLNFKMVPVEFEDRASLVKEVLVSTTYTGSQTAGKSRGEASSNLSFPCIVQRLTGTA